MPRKGNYGLDYDVNDYREDSEEYLYDNDADDDEEVQEFVKETNKSGLWRCSICTYDNENDLFACDICGVIRQPLDQNKLGRPGAVPKASGVSVMAKYLFASSSQFPYYAEKVQEFEVFLKEKFYMLGAFKGNFHEFHKALYSFCQSRYNIVPFKFDIPSPDDLVSHGLHFSKKDAKVIFEGNDITDDIVRKTLPVPLVQGDPDLGEGAKARHLKSEHEDVIQNSSSIVDKKHRFVEGRDSPIDETEPLTILKSKSSMSVDSDINSSKRRGKPQVHYQPEKWMLPNKTEETLNQLNLAIVGHVDSGKSTLSGRLLHLLGKITQKEMHKYEKEAKLQGKSSFAYAWALDESSEERERGITMTVAVAYFETQRYHVVVLDSPGHKDFVPNMISGAAQADAAILVIDAVIGAFEAGMDSSKGQTREHAQLIRSFGVEQLIVAVNKMDSVGYSRDRFDSIKLHLGTFLRSCSFKDSSVSWVPVSSLGNQNLVSSPSDERLSSWYRGPHLLNAIDSIRAPARDFAKPLLMPVCDVVKSSAVQVSVCGKLEAGALQKGSKVLFMPTGDMGTVRSLERDAKICNIARAGDSVVVNLSDIDGNNVYAGGVLCHPNFPSSVGQRLELKVILFEVKTPLVIGSQLEFHVHHAKEAATVARLVSLLDTKTGRVTKNIPRCMISKQSGIIEVVLQGPVCVEVFSDCRALGRVFLRSLGSTIAVGVVTKVI